jgi:hypothetical protein
MLRKCLAFISCLCLAAIPVAAGAQRLDGGPQNSVNADVGRPDGLTGGQSYGDRNRGGRSGFYSFPRHRHVDGTRGADARQFSELDAGSRPYCDTVNCHGSAYYGPDYGAPYHGGGYHERGTYYRERRD